MRAQHTCRDLPLRGYEHAVACFIVPGQDLACREFGKVLFDVGGIIERNKAAVDEQKHRDARHHLGLREELDSWRVSVLLTHRQALLTGIAVDSAFLRPSKHPVTGLVQIQGFFYVGGRKEDCR